MAHEIAPLPYKYSALEPHIDAETMRVHHDKHYQTYCDNLNAAVNRYPELADLPAEELLINIDSLPEDIQDRVKNNGGGFVNHTMFWEIMGPKCGGKPSGAFGEHIDRDFGSFDSFKEKVIYTGKKFFGSGWVWLVWNEDKLEIAALENQDSPLLVGHYPIMCIDLWEHSYYLKYKNDRAKYLEAWWNVANWQEIERRFVEALKFASR